jgi:hypothetical protein
MDPRENIKLLHQQSVYNFYWKRFCSVEFDIFVFSSLGPSTTQKSSHSEDFLEFNNYLPPPLVENVIGLQNNRLNCIVILR